MGHFFGIASVSALSSFWITTVLGAGAGSKMPPRETGGTPKLVETAMKSAIVLADLVTLVMLRQGVEAR